jgi:hypothetical protein
MDTENKKKPITVTRLFIYWGLLVFTLWGGWCALVQSGTLGQDWTTRGQFGDSFGALNTLFAGLAFAGVVVSLYRQHQDAEKAEELRRADKKDAEKAELLAEERRRHDSDQRRRARNAEQERHQQGLDAQERITKLQALTACLQSEERDYEATLKEIHYLRDVHAFTLAMLSFWRGNNDQFVFHCNQRLGSDGAQLSRMIVSRFGNVEGMSVNEVLTMVETDTKKLLAKLETRSSRQNINIMTVHAEIVKITGLEGLNPIADFEAIELKGRTADKSLPTD